MAEIPRFMLAAPCSGTGKTTVALALLSALIQRGFSPAAFKCGPDYIDPMFHRKVIGVPSYNLDLFLSNEAVVRGLLCRYGAGKDITVIEGVMGYYDGVDWTEYASSYDVAQRTQTPVILVIPVKGAALSLAAVVKGFSEFRKPSWVAGVILNNCSQGFYLRLKKTLEGETGLPVLGYLPAMPECSIESRHLGLVTAKEIAGLKEKLYILGHQAGQSINLNELLNLAKAAKPLYGSLPDIKPVTHNKSGNKPRIAVAQDAAFCFYYPDNLDLLNLLGAEVVPFSPLEDIALPEGTCGLYFGGGYPELYAKRLSENVAMSTAIRNAIQKGVPTIAQGGGFLYLQESLEDAWGSRYPMVGMLQGKGYRNSRLQRFGYATLTAQADNLLCLAGETVSAHELHYWESTQTGRGFIARKPDGRNWECIMTDDRIFAGFPHLYFYGKPVLAERFVKAVELYGGNL